MLRQFYAIIIMFSEYESGAVSYESMGDEGNLSLWFVCSDILSRQCLGFAGTPVFPGCYLLPDRLCFVATAAHTLVSVAFGKSCEEMVRQLKQRCQSLEAQLSKRRLVLGRGSYYLPTQG